jgi:hypothetical protein
VSSGKITDRVAVEKHRKASISLPPIHTKLSPVSSRYAEPALRCYFLSLTTVFGLTDDIVSASRIVAVTMAPIKVGFSCPGRRPQPPYLLAEASLVGPWLEGLKHIVWVLRKHGEHCSQLLTIRPTTSRWVAMTHQAAIADTTI